MAPGKAQPAPAAGPQKHRACDECRFRKIACSKEPDGCLRCQKEGITCVYSPQKPMGRPRKRRHAEASAHAAVSVTLSVSMPESVPAAVPSAAQTASSSLLASASASVPTLAPTPDSTGASATAAAAAAAAAAAPIAASAPHSSSLSSDIGSHAAAPSTYIDAGHHHNHHHLHHHHHHHNAAAHHHNHQQSVLPTDPGSGFMSQPLAGDLSYLDLLPDYDTAGSNLFGIDDGVSFDNMPRHTQGLFDGTVLTMNMSQADLFEGISFDETDPSSATMSKDLNDSLQRYMVSQYSQPPAPSESSPSTHSNCFESLDPASADTSSALGTPKPHPQVSCDCLSSLSAALGSLNRLPSDVILAMRVARNATKIAHDTLNCTHCYGDMYDLSKPAPISRFQNFMCLGALVPSACNAYASILEMVDRDTERAKQEYRLLYFSFKEVGGIWGSLIDDGTPSSSPDCALLKSYNNKYLEPDIWRTTIRAILKVDVYGFDHRTASVSTSLDCGTPPQVYLHRGLKDVIARLDEKNQKRHDIADALMQSSQVFPHSPYLLFSGPPKPCPREDRHCVRMLDVARSALSNLVIS
ncbi:fungal transcriptional regulatory [Trichoderma arundinaceum]|uniref:Fungal transcriptional regulatory n=1 Tax=Trichoderma arundinaceum TaxID=490622 RepID=A0A395NH89_TRIAR|nr:fungal transcriptional regulatory [Trichoderma arundinaceum]